MCSISFWQNWTLFIIIFFPQFDWNWSSVYGEEDFLIKSSQCILTIFAIISPWKSIEQFCFSFIHECLMPILVKIVLMVEKIKKMEKISDGTDDKDDRKIMIRKALMSHWLRWAKYNQSLDNEMLIHLPIIGFPDIRILATNVDIRSHPKEGCTLLALLTGSYPQLFSVENKVT